MRIGPQTGAGDGKREYNAARTVGRFSSGASIRAEAKYQKKLARQAARKAAREAKRRSA